MSENQQNIPRKMQVTVTLDEMGNVRTTAEPGMNVIEVLCMLQMAHEGIHAKAVEKNKVVIPRGPFEIVRPN